jgi:hypothetical protein
MKPGDTVRCDGCGREATAYTTGDPARWQDGDVLLVSWSGYRHEAVRSPPARCLFCADGTTARKAPTRRVELLDALALAGCRTEGWEWNTDQAVEDAFQRWIVAGRPRLALVAVHPPTYGSPPGAEALAAARSLVAGERKQLGLFGGGA